MRKVVPAFSRSSSASPPELREDGELELLGIGHVLRGMGLEVDPKLPPGKPLKPLP